MVSNNPRAVIFGIKGKSLLPAEVDFINQYNPLGFILFSRNIENKTQVRQLVQQIKIVTGRHTPILIDQEGGRVTRLKDPHWRHPPKAEIFGFIAKQDSIIARKACKLNAMLVALDLHELGINTNCAPLLDIYFVNSHSVIGDRAFSDNREIVTELGVEMMEGFISCGVCPIMKHIPGHGRARADSHLELPVIYTDYKTLLTSDFYPFIQLSHTAKWAMTAHILYNVIDANNPSTFSTKLINEIRHTINFKGIIITDCITMKALSGSVTEKASKSFAAGCDIVLHSNSNLDEMLEIVNVSPQLTDTQLTIIAESYRELKAPSQMLSYENLLNQFNDIVHKFSLSSALCKGFDPTE